jgi:hypothetical protein
MVLELQAGWVLCSHRYTPRPLQCLRGFCPAQALPLREPHLRKTNSRRRLDNISMRAAAVEEAQAEYEEESDTLDPFDDFTVPTPRLTPQEVRSA